MATFDEKTGWQKFVKYIEVPQDDDAMYKTDNMTNRDLIPMPPDRRTYKIWSYCVYWCISGLCISAYTLGSSLLSYGLNCKQALGAITVGAICVAPLVVACGWMGAQHRIGFTVASRFTWGVRGFYFPVIIRTFTTIFWDGLQAYWGGQSVACCLGAMSLSFHNMDTTLAGGVLMLRDLIGMLVYYVFFLSIMILPPERLQIPFIISSFGFIFTLIGLLAWSCSAAGGVGPLWNVEATPLKGDFSWAFLFGVAGVLGSWGGGTLGQSDWTRYAKKPYNPLIAQIFIAPLSIFICGLVGIIVTSGASFVLDGEIIWQPFQLLPALQEHYGNTSKARAAIFFAGAGCTGAQLGISIVLNSVSAGMDIAGCVPRFVNIRRGAYLMAVLGFASCPWEYLSNAAVFLTVIAGFGIFIAPFTGVMLADYFIVRRRTLVMEDLYIQSPESIYWFWNGFNWRPLVAWIIGLAPLFPGFIMSITNADAWNGWVKLFHIDFYVGVSISFVAMVVICKIFPPPHLGEGVKHIDDSVPFGLREDTSSGVSVSNVYAGSSDASDAKDKLDDPEGYLPHPSTA